MAKQCTIGIDYGTGSVRAIVVETATGRELGEGALDYPHGDHGVVVSPDDPNLARQHPADYIEGLETTVRAALANAEKDHGITAADIIGIGVDTTGSTPIPVNEMGRPLALQKSFEDNPAALAWLWKDHTSHAEAAEITALAGKIRPQYLAKCGGTYSSEWYWAKLLHCLRTAPEVFDAAVAWVELCDWVPALLCGESAPYRMKRSICAAGHKALYHPEWNGWPDGEFLSKLDPALAKLADDLPEKAHPVGEPAGTLSGEWAERLGLKPGIPVSVGAFDAHLGAVGSGIAPGVLVKIMGTSSCDIMLAPLENKLADIPGLCGIVPESVLPGNYGIEAGQSAVGDIFQWFVHQIEPGGPEKGNHRELTRAAEALRPGESGLLALDWHNGNRTVLVDQRLTGMMLGMTLRTTPGEMFRALLEATAFGARAIVDRIEEYGVAIQSVLACGGIPAKNPLAMQILADVLNRPIEITRSTQTCALGAAMAGAVAAGRARGGHATFAEATAAMTGVLPERFLPNPGAVAVYARLYSLYHKLHDAFGVEGTKEELHPVMKELLTLRDEARGGGV